MGAPGMGWGPNKSIAYSIDDIVSTLYRYAELSNLKCVRVDLEKYPEIRSHPKVAVLLCSPSEKLIAGVGVKLRDNKVIVLVDLLDTILDEVDEDAKESKF